MLSEDSRMSYVEEDEELEDWPTSEPATPSRRRHLSDYDEEEELAPDEIPQSFMTHTSFDTYFLLASKPARTSSNVFSALVPPLTPEEYSSVLTRLQNDPRERERILWRDEKARKPLFRRYGMELAEGFNLMMYGYGSKREFLNAFAQELAGKGGHVVVANGFQPRFAFKDLLGAIEQIPGVLDGPSGSAQGAGQDMQVRRIRAIFSSGHAPHLYIIIHNIEGNAFRSSKNKAALGLLALAPHIHIVASVDHIAAPQRWSLSEMFARKPDPSPFAPSDDHNHNSSTATTSNSISKDAPPALAGVIPKRGFAWLWHDLTTLAPYDFELAFADPTSLSGAAALRGARAPAASSSSATAGGGTAAQVPETAARHVLASVTQKAKKLFVLLGAKQLEVMAAPAPAAGGAEQEEGAYDYDRLFAAARDNFVATNDAALRALLGEFRDHGLVVSAAAQGAEAMWIPMRREALLKIVGELKAEGH